MTTQDNNNNWFRLLAWGKQRVKSAVGIKAPTMQYDMQGRNYHACLPIYVVDVQVFFRQENSNNWLCSKRLVSNQPDHPLSAHEGIHLRTAKDMSCFWPDFEAFVPFGHVILAVTESDSDWLIIPGELGPMPQDIVSKAMHMWEALRAEQQSEEGPNV